jgi:hypothetical protein
VLASVDSSGADGGSGAVTQDSVANSKVLQLPPDWVEQDDNFRPVIVNPLPDPLQIVYVEGGDRRVLTIQPSTRIVLDLAHGAYSMTVMVLNAVGELRNAAVANMFSGPPPDSVPNVPVVVNNVTSKPIVVDQVTDLGEDSDVGMRKVLLDGATPAWGDWTQTSTGERQFVVRKTQQFPGIDAPAEGPLPGYRLVADSERLPSTDGLLILVAALIAALGLGAMVARVVRKQRSQRGTRGAHVQAVLRPGGALGVSVRETPAPGEATHAVRLAAHSEPCTLTIREVNDDHSHAE